jgi:hypothetical protein
MLYVIFENEDMSMNLLLGFWKEKDLFYLMMKIRMVLI